MGLKNFLKQQGFIEDDSADKKRKQNSDSDEDNPGSPVTPTYFPLQGSSYPDNNTSSEKSDPSFVTPLQQSTNTNSKGQPDPSFIKFFEDELVKANLPGPDYFEFRQLLIKTQQKMTAKGVAAPDVVLQAVLTSFEAQGIPPDKLVDAARKYKDILKQKNDEFLRGAATEKNNQLQKRQNVLQSHDDNIRKLEQQLQDLELQKQKLEASIGKEKTQLEVDKTLGKEGIEKIERAEKQIALANEYMQSSIDADIKRLQSL